MITDVHVHHVPAGFLRFVQDAAPCSIHLDDACGERVRLRVGMLSYDLNRTFFDIERLHARMNEMRVERALLSIATPFVNFDVPASLGKEAAQVYNDEISAIASEAPDRFWQPRANSLLSDTTTARCAVLPGVSDVAKNRSSCASDRHVSPVSPPFAQRSAFTSNAASHAATLLMMPSLTPSRSSHFA